MPIYFFVYMPVLIASPLPGQPEMFFRTYCCKIHTCIGNSDTKAQSLAPRLFVYLHSDNWSIFSRNFWEKNQTWMFDLVTLQSALLTRFHHTGDIMLHNSQSPSMRFFIKIPHVLLRVVASFAKSRSFFCVCFCDKTRSTIVHWGWIGTHHELPYHIPHPTYATSEEVACRAATRTLLQKPCRIDHTAYPLPGPYVICWLNHGAPSSYCCSHPALLFSSLDLAINTMDGVWSVTWSFVWAHR